MAWSLVAQLGLFALSAGISYLLRPKPKGERALTLNEFDFPRATEGDAIPLIYGTCRVNSPIVVGVGDLNATPRGDPSAPSFYSYDLGMRLLLGRGNAAVGSLTGGAQLLKVYEGDKECESLELNPALGPETPPGSFCDMYFAVVGGESPYTFGYLGFYKGLWSQTRIPDDIFADENASALTSYRGQIVVRLFQWNINTATTMPPLSFVVYNPVYIPGYEQYGAIGNGDANPAAVLYDLLCNPWGGVANASTQIDVDSFVAAAATLQDEQHGCSLLITSQTTAADAVESVLRQIDGVLYEDPATRRFKLRLIREDYELVDLPVFTTNNVLGDPEMSTTLWDEATNEVRVVFTNPVSGYQEAVALAQDMALISAAGGQRRTTEIRYPFVTSLQLALTLAARDLNLLSRPLARLQIDVNRDGFELVPGDPFVFTWPEWDGYSEVFRVIDLDFGTLTDGKITITAVQDRFAIGGSVFPPDDEIGPTPVTPDPIVSRIVTECPRWIQLKAYEAGDISNTDAQRGFYVAKPEGSDSRYRVTGAVDLGLEEDLISARAFPGGATVETQYARTTSAYDTTTGLRIEGLYGVTLASATQTEIATEGRNLIYVARTDGVEGEIMAFESATDLGGGVWKLNNVWRGVLDTVPATHAVGARVYFLAGDFAGSARGSRTFAHGASVVTRTRGAAGSAWVPGSDSPADTFTARSRVLLPYPPSDLKIQSSKTPSALEEGGVTVEWRTRDRLQGGITRPDATAETPEAGTNHNVVASKGTGADVEVALGHTSSSTTQVPLGGAGHGTLDVGARSYRTATLPGGTAATLSCWQRPKLSILAHHWRNLLRNPRFVSDLSYWDQVTGTAVRATSNPLGGLGAFLTSNTGGGVGNPGVVEYKQDIDISGYNPKNYNAVLDFFVKNTGDAGDTIQVDLRSLNAAGTVLQTSTYGPADPGTDWLAQSLEIADLHDDTAKIRVRVVMTATGEIDGTANVAFTEACLRVGQISAQLLSNASFEAGIATAWTASVGSWQVLTATKYDLTNYARPQNGASAQLRQAVSLPTGYELGAAVLECARMNDDADDTGTVTLEALDGGGSVVGSATTGAEALTPQNVWQRRRLVLDPIPASATQLRVTLDAARVTGTPLNACFDAFDLRCHKHLDPDEETVLVDGVELVEQPLPTSITDWKQHFPDVTPPDYAIYDGNLVGKLGIEPLLGAGAGCFANGKAVVSGPEGQTTTCFESSGTSTTEDEDIHTAPVGDAFANFGTADPFTVLVFLKAANPISAVCGVAGRVIDGRGWEMRLNSSGTPRVALYGASATKTVGGSAELDDGGLHGFALIYDNAGELLHVVDATGDYSTSTTGMGEMRATTPGKFRIMASGVSAQARLDGQVARVYIWRQALAPADITAVLRYADKPASALTSMTRTGTVACITGSDGDGVLVERFGPDRYAIAKDIASGRLGLVAMPALTNLAPSSTDWTAADWTLSGSGSGSFDAATDPTGAKIAAELTGASSILTLGLNTPLDFGATGVRYIHFFARGDVAHDAYVQVSDVDENVVDSLTFSVTAQWQLFTWAMDWDATGGTEGWISWYSTTDLTSRTMYVSPIMFIGGTAARPWPGTIPIGTPGATSPLLTIAPSSQFNREGEIEIELVNYDEAGVIANAHNNTNDNDRRRITWPSTGGGDIGSEHYTSAGVDDTSAAVFNTTVDIAEPWKARLRWNRAGTIDGVSSVFVVLRAEQGSTVEQDGGRAAIWTASTTALTRLALLHETGATSAMAGLVFGCRISARERKV